MSTVDSLPSSWAVSRPCQSTLIQDRPGSLLAPALARFGLARPGRSGSALAGWHPACAGRRDGLPSLPSPFRQLSPGCPGASRPGAQGPATTPSTGSGAAAVMCTPRVLAADPVSSASRLFLAELGARLTAGISALALQIGGQGTYLFQQFGQLQIGVLAFEPGRHLALRISFQTY